MSKVMTKEHLDYAVLGGAILAAGAGGEQWRLRSQRLGILALDYGPVVLRTIDEVDANDWVMTVSQVGAPSADHRVVSPRDLVRAAQLLMEQVSHSIGLVMSSEATTTNGWLQAAALRMEVLDASGDGRGHPTVEMGCLGFRDEPILQTAAGGEGARYLEVVAQGSVRHTAKLLRSAAIETQGIIGAARMPLMAGVIRERAALGAVSYQIGLGQAVFEARSAEERLERILGFTRGTVLATGPVTAMHLKSAGAFDDGAIDVADASGICRLLIWNEYMAALRDGVVLGRFPDLLFTLDRRTLLPVAAHEIEVGREVVVVQVDQERLPLGRGALMPEHLQEVWRRVGLAIDDGGAIDGRHH